MVERIGHSARSCNVANPELTHHAPRINIEKCAYTLYLQARIDLSENTMKPDPMRTLSQPGTALLRSGNEEGAHAQRPPSDYFMQLAIRQSISRELKHLRVQMTAMESLLITLLAQSSDRPSELDREMAIYTFPSPGFTQLPRPPGAAAQMVQLVERAGHFRSWIEGKALS